MNLAAALGSLGESVLVVDLNASPRTSLCYGLEDAGEEFLHCLASPSPLALTVHPHPTWPESLMEAAEAVHKKAIHILNA